MNVDWNGDRRRDRLHARGSARQAVRPAAGQRGRTAAWTPPSTGALPAGRGAQPAVGESVPLRSSRPAGQRPWDVPVPALSATAGRRRRRRGGARAGPPCAVRVALVAGRCTDLTAAADALATAGASALVATPADGADCAGTLTAPRRSRRSRSGPFDVPRLSAGGAAGPPGEPPEPAATSTTSPEPGTATCRPGRRSTAPARRRGAGRALQLARGPTAQTLSASPTMPIGWVPGRGSAAYGLVRPVAVPGTVTHYVSPIAEWERTVRWRTPRATRGALLRAEGAGGRRAPRPRTAGSPDRSPRRVSPLAAQLAGRALPTARATTCGCSRSTRSTRPATRAPRSTWTSSRASSTATRS